MATWQFSMHLVPRDGLSTVSPDLLAAFRDDDDESEVDPLSWTTTQPVSDLVERLSQILPEVECWDAAARQWGPTDRTTVQVSYKDDRVVEIWARLDVREVTARVIEILASLASDSDGWWVGGDSQARMPIGQTSREIATAIERSDAARFVTDPEAFLGALPARQGPPR